MTEDSVGGAGMTIWRAWTARLALQRAILKGQFAGMGAKRAKAQKRAAAAEMIAQEANAARLKVLLEAARGQAATKPIESAERRFAEAKGVWEAAQHVLPKVEDDRMDAAPNQDIPPVEPIRMPAGGPFLSPSQLALRAAAAIALAALGVFLYMDPEHRGGNEIETARPAVPAAVLPESAPPAAAPGPVSSLRPAAELVFVRQLGEERPDSAPTPRRNPFRAGFANSEGTIRPLRGVDVE